MLNTSPFQYTELEDEYLDSPFPPFHSFWSCYILLIHGTSKDLPVPFGVLAPVRSLRILSTFHWFRYLHKMSPLSPPEILSIHLLTPSKLPEIFVPDDLQLRLITFSGLCFLNRFQNSLNYAASQNSAMELQQISHFASSLLSPQNRREVSFVPLPPPLTLLPPFPLSFSFISFFQTSIAFYLLPISLPSPSSFPQTPHKTNEVVKPSRQGETAPDECCPVPWSSVSR